MTESKKILSNDIIDDKLFVKVNKNAEDFEKQLTGLIIQMKAVNKEQADFIKINSDPKTAKEMKAVTDAIKAENTSRIAANKLLEQEEKLKQIKLKTLEAEKRAQQNAQKEIEKSQKQKEKELKLLQDSESAYKRASKQLNDLRNNYKDLAISGQSYTAESKAMLIQIQRLDKELKAVDASVGQFNREVGNYENAIGNAITKTGIFGGVISKLTTFVELYEATLIKKNIATERDIAVTSTDTATHVANTASLEAETLATEQLTLAKRVLNAITSPVGILIAVGAALYGLVDAINDVNQAFRDKVDIDKAIIEDATLMVDIYEKEARAVISFRKEVGQLTLDLLKLKDVEHDLTEISNDSSLSLGQREEASKKAREARIISAKAELNIEQRRLELTNLATARAEANKLVGKGKALQEFYDKQIEGQKAVFEATDRLDDLVRTNAEEERKIIQNKTIYEIELTRSKKLNANSQTATLTSQLSDEKIQLEKRMKLRIVLNNAELKIQQNQFDIFNKGIEAENVVNEKAGEILKKRVDFEELVATKDATILAKKIEALVKFNITEEQGLEVAKLVKEAQLQRITNNDIIIKQTEELTLRLQKLNDIQLENVKSSQQLELDLLKDKEQKKLDILTENNTKILQVDNVFNEKLNKQRDKSVGEYVKAQEEAYTQRENQLKLDAIISKTQIENSEKDEVIKKEKIKQVDLKYSQDLELLQLEESNKRKADEEAENEVERKIQVTKTEFIIGELQKVTSQIGQELDNRNQLQEQKQDDEINKRQNKIEAERDRANKGLANQLAFEEQQQAKAQLAKRDLEEKVARQNEVRQLIELFYSSYQNELKQPEATSTGALLKAGQDVLLGKALAKGIAGAFYEGTESVEDSLQNNKVHNGKDGYVIAVDGKERILNPMQNAKVGDISNDSLADLAWRFNNGLLPKVESSTSSNIYNSIILQSNAKIENLLQILVDKPVQMVDVDSMGNIRETIITQTKKVIVNHIQKPRLC